MKSSGTDEDVPTSAVEIAEDLLPANVAESLDVWVECETAEMLNG